MHLGVIFDRVLAEWVNKRRVDLAEPLNAVIVLNQPKKTDTRFLENSRYDPIHVNLIQQTS